MSNNPEDRFDDVASFVRELEKTLAPKQSSLRAALFSAGLTVGLAALAAGIWWPRDDPRCEANASSKAISGDANIRSELLLQVEKVDSLAAKAVKERLLQVDAAWREVASGACEAEENTYELDAVIDCLEKEGRRQDALAETFLKDPEPDRKLIRKFENAIMSSELEVTRCSDSKQTVGPVRNFVDHAK